MRIQMSEDIYDYLVECEPKFVIIRRGLRNVLVRNLLYTGLIFAQVNSS